MPKFNTLCDVAFTVLHDCEKPEDIAPDLLLVAMQKRVDYLRDNPSEIHEAVGFSDTIDEE